VVVLTGHLPIRAHTRILVITQEAAIRLTDQKEGQIHRHTLFPPEIAPHREAILFLRDEVWKADLRTLLVHMVIHLHTVVVPPVPDQEVLTLRAALHQDPIPADHQVPQAAHQAAHPEVPPEVPPRAEDSSN